MSLTKYQEGSLAELWKIALPLMLSSLSVMSMIFVDRLLLAYYSPAALNATVNATTFGWSFLFGWMVMTGIAEVFVAQYNGARDFKKIGEPVWQMIWLSIGSTFFFIPFGIWGVNWVYGTGPQHFMERDYLRWMMFFGPSVPLYTALCGFFVGRGKTNLVTLLAIGANLINACLDYVFIFGIENVLEPMGVKGAAIATSGSSVFQMGILFYFFLKKENREAFGTGKYAFRWEMFCQCFKFGAPGAVFAAFEILGWAAFYAMMTWVSDRHITVAGITQSIVILLFFFAEGVSKAVSAIVGNLIGAGREYLVSNVFISGVKLQLIFFLLLIAIFSFFTDLITAQFLSKVDPKMVDSLQGSLRVCVIFTIIHLFLEGIRLLLAGILTAAGDTIFLLLGGSLSVWIFLVLPVYLFIVQAQMSVEVGSLICIFYSLIASIIYYWRYAKGRWQNVSLISTS